MSRNRRKSWATGIAVCATGTAWITGVVAGEAVGAAAPAASPAPRATVDAGTLVAALAAADTVAFALELDRLLYEDAVAVLPEAERPARPPCPLDALRRSLSTISVLLALVPDGDLVWACAIESDAIHARRLDAPHVAALGPRLAAWASDPSDHPYDAHAALAIHNNLFPPLGSILAGKRHVIIAAGGILRTLPFEALLLTSFEGTDVATHPYLLNRFEVAHETTLGSRMGWSSRPGDLLRLRTGKEADEPLLRPIPAGTLVAVAADPLSDSAADPLRWIRKGARGALLGGTEPGMDALLRAYFRERSSARMPEVRAVHRAKMALLRSGAPVEDWAWPRLFGAE